VREVGATPVLRTSRVGSAALVAPTSRTPHTNLGPDQVPDSALGSTEAGPE
jgi:hypothetical protein